MPGLGRRSRGQVDIWPGFVDALASLLLVIIFVVLVFVLGQFFLSQALSGRDQTITKLTKQLADLATMLDLERSTTADLKNQIGHLTTELDSATGAVADLKSQLADADARIAGSDAKLAKANSDLTASKTQLDQAAAALDQIQADRTQALAQLAQAQGQLKDSGAQIATLTGENTALKGDLTQSQADTKASRDDVARLAQEIQSLQQELARISGLLQTSEASNEQQKVQIANLGQRLNEALATKVEELARYRSEFFGRLNAILGNRPGIKVEGDRFVFQSELLFDSGSDQLGASGALQLIQLADTLQQVARQIPTDIPWVLRVDGHTDDVPIHSDRFPSNWELSTARAVSVVKFLASQGIAPEDLAAAGFAQFDPIDPGDSPAARARNRRIEIRLDQR